MGKIKKKFSEGSSRTYTTRNRALRKLQVSLADFRRLCILKGIYPVEPRSQKKANRGSSKPTTFYYAKDIQLLLSEPLIAKFREHKIFLRKLQRALGKDDLTRAKGLEARRPEYTLDHLVIERYPAFVDALRDLDDALCMVFLFATMPTVSKVNNEIVEDCKRLSTEFMHYVIHSHSLRKVFLSIKGIYYQAEIQGQSITWIVPYQFSQNVPLDVDFKVMATFLQFYRTLLGFVNYRLYTTSNLSYPPKVDQSMDDSAAGLGSLRIEAKRVEDLIKGVQSSDTTSVPEVTMSKQMKQRMDTLGSKIKKIVAADTTTPAYEAVGSGEADGDVDDETRQSGNLLFGKQVFFLSREVPRYSLEFVVRAFGGRLGWDQTSGGGSPYAENDRAITVQISDRPVQGHQFLDRIYVQPQWVYDSINARRLLDVEDYLIGQPLPAHLSPFVEYEEGDYVPEAASKLAAAAGFEGEVTNLKPEDRDQSEDEDEDAEEAADIDGASADEDAPDSDEEDEEDEDAIAEKQHQKQLLAERAGVSFSEYQQKQGAKPKPKAVAGKKRTKAEVEEEERQKIAISMLSKKKRKVVNRTQADAYKKAKDVNTLKTRKAQATAKPVKSAKGKKN
ncbi:mRNA-binding ribosome synthesis protein nop7 [Coemansia aciculifera]|uniref:Pescadillo homolog n=1 Tax=Coemansia aciculifera TaxID=417176 RepID=A0A9W8IRP7_9FUNG|nr:mRNA-binding ribosome synthesis protein nop7 [Coemansia aciculifera]KAJ2875506.1 mRNA-binding ribosome synthesis protein nop7 [Coemansia aciculifera]